MDSTRVRQDEAGADSAQGGPDWGDGNAGSGEDFRRGYVFVAALNMFHVLATSGLVAFAALLMRHAVELADAKDKRAYVLSSRGAVEKVDALMFSPGRPRFVREGAHRWFNTWREPRLRPLAGDPAPALVHAALMFDGDWAAIAYFLDYFAFLAQRPGAKVRAAILMIAGQGVGKGVLGRLAAVAVGAEYTRHIGPRELASDFNSWAERARLVIVDEAARDSRRSVVAQIKSLITEGWIMVNRKMVPVYEIENHAHILGFSNDADAFVIDEDDRRFLVWNSRAAVQGAGYYDALSGWIDRGGDAVFLNYLLNRDISGFNPNAAPPRTPARQALVAEGRPAAFAYLDELRESGAWPFNRRLVAAIELIDAVADARQGSLHPRQAARYLLSVGAKAIGQRQVGATKPRLWALDEHERWAAASLEAVRAEYHRRPGDDLPSSPGPSRRLTLGEL